MADEHYLYAISNDSTDAFPENTLTKFSNLLPKSLNLMDQRWVVAVVSFGCHLRLDHLWFPRPIMILERMAPSTQWFIVQGNRDYPLKTMLDKLNHVFGPLTQFSSTPQSPHRVKVTWKNCGDEDQIFKVYDDWLTRLGFDLPNDAVRMEAGYFKIKLQPERGLEGKPIGIHKARHPGLIQIHANIIEPHPHRYSQTALVKALAFQEEQGVFVHHQVPLPHYFPINRTQLDSVHVRLLDQDGDPLPLLAGQPSSVLIMNPDLNLQLDSSQPGLGVEPNTNHRFKIHLAKAIQLGPHARLALTQAFFPNAIRNVPDHLSQKPFEVVTPLGRTPVRVAPGFYPTLDVFIEAFNRGLAEAGLFSTIKAGHNGRRFTLESLKLKWPIDFLVPPAWWRLLGTGSEPNKRGDNAILTLPEPGHVYQCLEDMDPYDYYPHLIIVYANVVQHSIVGDRFYPILKTLSTPPYSKDRYHQCIAEHLEFLPLATTNLSEMEIELRGSDGRYVEFDTEDRVIINVTIQDSR